MEVLHGVLYCPGGGDPDNYVRADVPFGGETIYGGSGWGKRSDSDPLPYEIAVDELVHKLKEEGFHGKIYLKNCGIPDYFEEEYVRGIAPPPPGKDRARLFFRERPEHDYAKHMPKRWVFGENESGCMTFLVKPEGIEIDGKGREGQLVRIKIPWEEMDRMQIHVREDLQ